MSEKVKVRVHMSVDVQYRNTVEITQEEWEALKAMTDRELNDEHNSPVFSMIDFNDPLDMSDFQIEELCRVDGEGKCVEPI